MRRNEMLTLYRYNAWANARILNAAAQVTPGQFLTPTPFSPGGLRGTLVHTLFAEWLWRNRWEGHSPTTRLTTEEVPTFDTLRTRWQLEGAALLAFAENVTAETLAQNIKYQTTSGQQKENILWQLMLHLVNHGTQHRSEAAAILTGLGHSPGDIDLIVYFREMKK